MTQRPSKNLIVRQRQPDNREGPQEVFRGHLTPVQQFFVRNHFEIPDLDAESWSISIEGAVDEPGDWDLADLERFDQRTLAATLECAGNSRARLGKRASGVPWEQGAIGTAKWTGVPLDRLLAEVGLGSEVREMVFVGADRGTVETADGGVLQMPYARSLPVDKATSGDVLVATAMNGRPLSDDHGYPARLLVPGWYGMASVKWLVRIVAIPHRFDGYFQTEDYARWELEDHLPVRRPLGPMAVKSHIGTPIDGQRLLAGQTVTVGGFAWGGEGEIEGVEISVDGGDNYRDAELLDSPSRYAWRPWRYDWDLPSTPGTATLCSRARTDQGEIQPVEHDWNNGAYAVNAIRSIQVAVETPHNAD